MKAGWTKAEKAAKRRELAAWIALKKAQVAKTIQEMKAELKLAIASKRQTMMRPPREPRPGTPAAFAAAKERAGARADAAHRARKTAPSLGPMYESGAAFTRRMKKKKPKKRAAKKRAAAPAKKKKTRRAKRR